MKKGSLQYLPVSIFGSTVAISGLSITWNQASALFGLPIVAAIVIGIVAWICYLFLLLLYLTKIFRYPQKVKDELTHPVMAHSLGTFFISAVLLAEVTIPFSLSFGRMMWMAGTAGGFVFLYALTARLLKGQLSAGDVLPPVLIPGLTALNAANTGAGMQFGNWGKEADLILFSVGIVYVLLFFVLISYRLIQGGTILASLVPTLLLVSAPFEVGFLAYMHQAAAVDCFASVLFFFGLSIFVVLFFKVFKRGLPFMISWWAACFSTVALANAAFSYANVSHDIFVSAMAGVLLIGASLLIVITFAFTLRLLRNGKLLVPPEIKVKN
jgi:tellurite resistance protein